MSAVSKVNWDGCRYALMTYRSLKFVGRENTRPFLITHDELMLAFCKSFVQWVWQFLYYSIFYSSFPISPEGAECKHLTLIWIWIHNRQNLRWSITSMSVLRCLWHGAQLRLERRDSVCVHCRLAQRIPLRDGSSLWSVDIGVWSWCQEPGAQVSAFILRPNAKVLVSNRIPLVTSRQQDWVKENQHVGRRSFSSDTHTETSLIASSGPLNQSVKLIQEQTVTTEKQQNLDQVLVHTTYCFHRKDTPYNSSGNFSQ